MTTFCSDYRLYAPEELEADGYPRVWHRLKHEVRERAGYRCVRCGHPYRNGEHGSGQWSPCDELCDHDGPVRYRYGRDAWWREADALGLDSQVRRDLRCGWMDSASGKTMPKPEIQARWRVLTVHHLDGNKGNLNWWNLVALDQRCHLQIQGKVKMERAFIFEHSEWFKPHAAGWYAWKYLGEDLSREEVEARMEELLALERLA